MFFSIFPYYEDFRYASFTWNMKANPELFLAKMLIFNNGSSCCEIWKEPSPSDKALLNSLQLMESYGLLNLSFSDGMKPFY